MESRAHDVMIFCHYKNNSLYLIKHQAPNAAVLDLFQTVTSGEIIDQNISIKLFCNPLRLPIGASTS